MKKKKRRNSYHRSWTRANWLEYRAWAERKLRELLNWYRISLAVEEMESRED